VVCLLCIYVIKMQHLFLNRVFQFTHVCASYEPVLDLNGLINLELHYLKNC